MVQKHAARRLHYDFRLELDGVLKSWAIPKGPSLDPADKRLAIEVEDHPLEYAGFEGRIPEGEYGAGEVIVWDQGTWTPKGDPHEGLAAGRLKFELSGQKLRGAWMLVRMRSDGRMRSGKPQWLLFKERDTEKVPPQSAAGAAPRLDPKIAGAKRAPLPQAIEPQLATLVAAPKSGRQWLHEIKFDGYRILAYLADGKVELRTRRQQDWTARYPAVAKSLSAFKVRSAVFDGEIVALLPSGVSSFQALQNALREKKAGELVYYVFDLLYLDGYDLRAGPLLDRKELLKNLLAAAGQSSRVRLSEHLEGDGPALFAQCCKMGLEGIISKRIDRPYFSGRSADWTKSKCVTREELVIGGYTLSTAIPRGIGALLVGYYDAGRLIYAGRVGTGFTSETLLDLRRRLERLRQEQSPFAAIPVRERDPSVHWVRPELLAQVEFTGWTDSGVLRHPSFQGLREDKPPAEVTRPQSLARKASDPPAPEVEHNARPRQRGRGTQVAAATQPPLSPSISVKLTNPERVLYPDTGLTKLGLATYYAEVAAWMLPHVVDRPLSLVRCPRGQLGKCFFQKHAAAGTPAELARIDIREKDKTEEYLYVRNAVGLVALAQMSILEIHVWGSRRDQIERPDRIVIDLDPHESVAWSQVVEAALEVRETLAASRLDSFVRTTGGKGLHVVVPLAPRRHDWEAVKRFAKHVADALAARRPERYTASASKAARTGKIFIDYLRNGRGATAIAPYSPRAKPGAPVAVPLAWDELTPALRSDHFHVGNLPGRLHSLRDDPWHGIGEVHQALPTAP